MDVAGQGDLHQLVTRLRQCACGSVDVDEGLVRARAVHPGDAVGVHLRTRAAQGLQVVGGAEDRREIECVVDRACSGPCEEARDRVMARRCVLTVGDGLYTKLSASVCPDTLIVSAAAPAVTVSAPWAAVMKSATGPVVIAWGAVPGASRAFPCRRPLQDYRQRRRSRRGCRWRHVSPCVMAEAVIVSVPPPVAIERAGAAAVVTLRAPVTFVAARLPCNPVTAKFSLPDRVSRAARERPGIDVECPGIVVGYAGCAVPYRDVGDAGRGGARPEGDRARPGQQEGQNIVGVREIGVGERGRSGDGNLVGAAVAEDRCRRNERRL